MVTDATRKYREPMAYGLIAVAVLVFIGSLSLLFKSGDDLGGNVGFAEKSALFGTLFESALLVLSLVGAVILVTRLGEHSANARVVVLAALGIAGLDLLFALITFFAQFAADSDVIGDRFAGVTGAGKAVGVILGLAQLLVPVIALGYICTAFQSLPAPAAKPAPQWGGGPGFGSYGAPNQQGWAQPEQGYGQGQQQSWGQQGSSYGWAPPGDSQPPAWGHQPSGGGWGAPAAGGWPQQPGYAAPPAAPYPMPPTAPTGPSGGDAPPRTGSTAWGTEPPSTGAEPGTSPEPVIAEEETPLPPHESQADDRTADQPPATETAEDQPRAGEGWWQHPGNKPSDP